MSNQGPCFKCERRHLRCHSECENYKAYKDDLISNQQKINSEKYKYKLVNDYDKEKLRKLSKIYKGK